MVPDEDWDEGWYEDWDEDSDEGWDEDWDECRDEMRVGWGCVHLCSSVSVSINPKWNGIVLHAFLTETLTLIK